MTIPKKFDAVAADVSPVAVGHECRDKATEDGGWAEIHKHPVLQRDQLVKLALMA